MKLIIILGVIVKLASVSGDCDVGKTIQDFDITKFSSTWFFLYHSPGTEYNKVECPTDIYSSPDGKISRMVSITYDKSRGRMRVKTGVIEDWNNTGYSQIYDGNITTWNGRTSILAVDYDRYFIGKLCTFDSDKSVTVVAFRYGHPDRATMKAAKKALSDNGINFRQLKDWNPDRCLDGAKKC